MIRILLNLLNFLNFILKINWIHFSLSNRSQKYQELNLKIEFGFFVLYDSSRVCCKILLNDILFHISISAIKFCQYILTGLCLLYQLYHIVLQPLPLSELLIKLKFFFCILHKIIITKKNIPHLPSV